MFRKGSILWVILGILDTTEWPDGTVTMTQQDHNLSELLMHTLLLTQGMESRFQQMAGIHPWVPSNLSHFHPTRRTRGIHSCAQDSFFFFLENSILDSHKKGLNSLSHVVEKINSLSPMQQRFNSFSQIQKGVQHFESIFVKKKLIFESYWSKKSSIRVM